MRKTIQRIAGIGVVALLVTTPVAGRDPGPASAAEQAYFQAYFLEMEAKDFAGAAKLYEQVANDSRAAAELREQARQRLGGCQEELASADLAGLMPSGALVYAEFSRPGEHLVRLLGQLGLAQKSGGLATSAGKRLAIDPALVQELFGLRGVAVAVTGVDPIRQKPAGVLVAHPGSLTAIRRLLETALPMGAKPAEPIGGFTTFSIEDQVLVTLTSRLIVASPQAGLIEGVVRKLRGGQDASLADDGAFQAALAGRNDSMLFFCVNAKPLMPMVSGLMAAQMGDAREAALLQAVLDPNNLKMVSGQAGVGEDGLSFELGLELNEGHHNLLYNFLRTPPVNRETLRSVPASAAAFLAGALNEAPSRFQSEGTGGASGPAVVTAMDIGRELFGNITSFSVFVVPPEGQGGSASGSVPDVGLVMTVNDPNRSVALWSQFLGIASLATGAGSMEGSAAQVEDLTARVFALPEGAMVHVATMGNDLLLTTTRSALTQAVAARKSGKSVLDDPAFARSLAERLGPQSTKALYLHGGRCLAVARGYLPADEVAELELVAAAMRDTVASLVVNYGPNEFRVSGRLSGVPDVGELVSVLLEEQQRQAEMTARVKAAAKDGRWDDAVAAVDALLAAKPGSADLLRQKFDLLAIQKKDRAAALEVGEAFFRAAERNARALNNFAWALLTEKKYQGQFSELALKLARRCQELTEGKVWAYVDTLALAHFETGDLDRAIALEKQAIELSDGAGLKEMKAALKRFEEAQAAEKVAKKEK